MKRTTPVIPAEDIQRQKEYCAELRALNAQLPAPPKAWVDTYGCQQNEADSERIRGYLEKMGFFRLAKAEAGSGERAAEKVPGTPLSLMEWPIEEVEAHFRELGLTRQQAMIAAMLARKTPDAAICETLNISPSTLKTHIRNIHRRLGISSRHELAWLVTAAPAAGEAPSNR